MIANIASTSTKYERAFSEAAGFGPRLGLLLLIPNYPC
jgi:hypothetical protein